MGCPVLVGSYKKTHASSSPWKAPCPVSPQLVAGICPGLHSTPSWQTQHLALKQEVRRIRTLAADSSCSCFSCW